MKDPVCGMTVTKKSSPAYAYLGDSYYFCSAGCKSKFAADPQKYLAPPAVVPPAPVAGAIYTCPMHPAVRQDHPGSCPHCGMALEPEMPSLGTGAALAKSLSSASVITNALRLLQAKLTTEPH